MRIRLAVAVALLWLGSIELALAEPKPDPDQPCAAHAATMVAEMEATSTTPLSVDERELVRRTALKSCLAQTGTATGAAEPQPATATTGDVASKTAVASTTSGGFWGFLSGLREPRERTAGHKRLQQRSRGY
jgi:hypothetical protein